MYNEQFFHDGDSGQIILPIPRPGNSHSNRWYVGILRRIVRRVHEVSPEIEIVIRVLLLKVGGTIRKTKKRIRHKLSKSFVYRDLFVELIVS